MNSFLKFLTNVVFVLFGLGPDVVTVSLGTAGNAGSTAAELITYMSARLLEVAELNTILDQWFVLNRADLKSLLNILELQRSVYARIGKSEASIRI